jgi:hypothetical protein
MSLGPREYTGWRDIKNSDIQALASGETPCGGMAQSVEALAGKPSFIL